MRGEITYQGEIVGPELAQQLLSYNTHNRMLSESHIETLADLMKRGLWKRNAQPVQFIGTPDNPIRCIDGQHRLHAIVKAGVDVYMTLAFNVPEESADTIDNGKRRTHGDHIFFRVPGIKPGPAKEIGVIVPTLIIYERPTIVQWCQSGQLAMKGASSAEVVNYVQKHKEELLAAYEWVDKHCFPTRKSLRSRSEMMLIRVLTRRVDPAASDSFCSQIYGGVNLQPETIEKVIYSWLLDMMMKEEEKHTTPHIRYTMAKAWNKIRSGNNKNIKLRHLIYKEGEPAQRFK